ncbi:hypothetical protein L2E82_23116 [Cichorium intybus]|uniref:Uncharacterized protein n=1 Tax=Cichorium intybus TaxID=13427 RepID=A0ACB9DZM2_CICIN|nr:hypothetical protein L2E82_23116 [Cichorium intybus]
MPSVRKNAPQIWIEDFFVNKVQGNENRGFTMCIFAGLKIFFINKRTSKLDEVEALTRNHGRSLCGYEEVNVTEKENIEVNGNGIGNQKQTSIT